MENVDLQTKKRERAVNFMPSETRLLMDLVFKFRNIIENKKTDAITNKEKDTAWTKIADLFNSASGVNIRSSKNLKLKYESVKKNTNKKAAHNRQELYKTGGGEATPAVFSVAEEKVLAMCSNIDGLEARNDSDSLTTLSTSITPGTIQKTSPTSPSNDATDNMMDQEQIELNVENALNDNEGASYSKWQTWTPKALKTKTNPVLRRNNTKTNIKSKYDELGESRLGLVELQKRLVQKELEFKQFEHDLHIQHKTEEHELRILYLHNEEKRKQEAHNLKIQEFKK